MNKNLENIALFDMDGTLCDFEGTLKSDLKKLAGPNEPEYPLHDEANTPEYIIERMRLIKKQPNWWFNLPVLNEGLTFYHLCKTVGFDIHILTKGPKHTPNAWTEKLLWSQKHLGMDIPVTITFDKGLTYGKVLVDDWPEYIERWLKWRPRGLVIMPVREYNKDFKHPNVFQFNYYDFLDQKKLDETKGLLQKVFERDSGEKIVF